MAAKTGEKFKCSAKDDLGSQSHNCALTRILFSS